MFRCPIAEFQWVVIRDGLKWFSYPWSMQDFSENFLTEWEKSEISVMWFLFGAILWILWFNRNDCVFNNLVIFSPRAVIFRMVAARTEDKVALEGMVDAIKAQAAAELDSNIREGHPVTKIWYQANAIQFLFPINQKHHAICRFASR
jgi:hypothetical protein